MKRGAPLLLVLLACAAASPSPVPVVVAAPPPLPPSATVTATASTPASDPPPEAVDEDALREACEERLREASAGPFTKLEECDELRTTLVGIRNDCGYGSVSSSFYDSLDCIDEVTKPAFKALLDTLSATDRKRQEKAVAELATGRLAFCDRPACGDYYRSHCMVGIASCYATLVDEAARGQLSLEPGAPERALASRFAAFARSLCALPKRAWKGGKAPPKCVDRALAMLETCPGPDSSDCGNE